MYLVPCFAGDLNDPWGARETLKKKLCHIRKKAVTCSAMISS